MRARGSRHRRANAAEAGAAELMANLFYSYREPVSDALLFDWHALLMNGRRDIADIGRYRTMSSDIGRHRPISGDLIFPFKYSCRRSCAPGASWGLMVNKTHPHVEKVSRRIHYMLGVLLNTEC